MTSFSRTHAVLDEAIARRVFPGAVVEIGSTRGTIATLIAGSLTYDAGAAPAAPDTVYDLASLTKVLSTATLASALVDRGVLNLDDRVNAWSPAWHGSDRDAVTLRLLLLHASGLPAHRRYFERLRGGAAFEAAIGHEPLEYQPGTQSVYSDPGFILLGRVLERAGGAQLDVQFTTWLRTHIGDEPAVLFNPTADAIERIAPTEQDPWRSRLLRGEVHDENAAALDGVAGHAGLFGTAAGVGLIARWWLSRSNQEPWKTFASRGAVPGSSRALGWDTMLPTSSCGTCMSPAAFGHTGFTGTSLWIDPSPDRYVAFLSNRVHPTRAGDGIASVRRALHDAIAVDLGDT
ncbi:MAG TPA: serine hydrolase domain-containing protein [Vicinamibacterales bacterium]|nr:serine hydrolase domain-containing protein [Vicinamibacterales bacterium]